MAARILIALVLALGCACAPERPERRLVIAIESAPLTLDPRGAFNADTAHVQQLLFNTLVTKGPDFDLAPDLAESWEVSADATEATFHLRAGVHFHDGRPLTARDAVYTFDSLIAHRLGKSSAFAAVDRVEAVDGLTVRFVSKRQNPGLLVDLVAVGILPEGSGEEATSAPVGTGPFRVATAYPGEGDLRLDAFANYFGGAPKIDGIDVRVIPDAATRAASIESGEVDLVVNPGLAPDALARFPRVVEAPGGGVQFVVLNTEKLADPRVRQALALAVDRQQIVSTLLGGRAQLASTPLPPGHWAALEIPQAPYDPDMARRMLGGTLRVELMILPTTADRDLAAVLQEFWRAVGVETTIVPAERAVFAERLANGDFVAAIHRFTGGNQFTTIFKGAFHSRSIHDRAGTQGELNYARYADPEFDALVDLADRATDRLQRVALYGDAQRRIAQATPWILLWYPDNVAVAGPRVGEFSLDFATRRGGDFYFMRSLTLK